MPATSATIIDTLQPVELADGVEIHLRVAGPAVRSVAWLVDFLIFIVALVIWGIAVILIAGSVGAEIGMGLFLLGMFVMSWFYNVIFEMSAQAATPGQRMMKIKVASVSGAPVRLPQSLIRLHAGGLPLRAHLLPLHPSFPALGRPRGGHGGDL